MILFTLLYQIAYTFTEIDENVILFFLNVYLFLRDRERQSMSRGGAEREGDTESKAGSRL